VGENSSDYFIDVFKKIFIKHNHWNFGGKKMFFEDDCGKILTEEDINTMLPWEIDDFRLHVHENAYDYRFIDECELLDKIKKTKY
jgi:hypothetical protein